MRRDACIFAAIEQASAHASLPPYTHSGADASAGPIPQDFQSVAVPVAMSLNLPARFEKLWCHLQWYFDHYNRRPSEEVLNEWRRCLTVVTTIDTKRAVKFHVWGHDWPLQSGRPRKRICVTGIVNGIVEGVWMKEITGSDYAVQAALASRPGATNVIKKIVHQLEGVESIQEFGIFCARGKHRSPGIAFLLHELVYTEARLYFEHPDIPDVGMM